MMRAPNLWTSMRRAWGDRQESGCPAHQNLVFDAYETQEDLCDLSLIAYRTAPHALPIMSASPSREWMDQTNVGFANRCLPMRIANQAGWFIVNDRPFEIQWNGGKNVEDLQIKYGNQEENDQLKDYPQWATSHFGYGIVTWRIPYVFRTPKGYNLYVRGPANHCKDGVCPLDAIVETDWMASTFTMNWKVTRIDTSIVFDRGEPICMMFPQKRGELELFHPQMHFIREEPELERQYKKWSVGRYEFNQNLDANPAKPLWQKDYYAGRTPDGDAFVEHQVRLNIRDFIDKTRGAL